MRNLQIYFSDFFNVSQEQVESYGAVNISLINDMPLFVDPFLLFNSKKKEYQDIHDNIIKYLLFLQSQAERYPTPPKGMLSSWYYFSEVKQTWLGFSQEGNSGRGLGKIFAKHIHEGLQTIFKDFGKEVITESAHLEKLCLISPLVGKDKISDFTTNFTKEYLLEYTSKFASRYISPEFCKEFLISKVSFDFNTFSWKRKKYILPCYNNDYVLLTPRDMLTRDDTFINKYDMLTCLEDLAPSIDDAALRFSLNYYLMEVLPKKKEEMTKEEKEKAANDLVLEHPEIIDYYIKYKEEHRDEATEISSAVVQEVRQLFNCQLNMLAELLNNHTEFYNNEINSHDEAHKRVLYLKNVIENMDGYKLFYLNGEPVHKEKNLQIMFKLVWFATKFDVNSEVNNGRGPVDFKVSFGNKDSTLVEFKLASNTKLRKNLENQVEIYQKANCTDRAIKVIMYFNEKELEKVNKILNDLNLHNCKDIILIDAINDKISASNV